ncbi:hypothetical protein FJV76_13825 [Mesorhizobium sp. WSM4303]|uniref:hypothetical protein n=1 Tax=unclassified Mesorhizobium TaxID=325217 RepID=UPI00115E5B8F|nr:MULTISPECIES: hypothetical protein [unclassified Mesorhizobium]TRC98370.1 hypothetical protein FJV77_07935 [Mesorhizobium sp. WSM4306]TRD04346.1 hypothetical protein FJV76_13825 [Mesorhizobium sp. WSM4303]
MKLIVLGLSRPGTFQPGREFSIGDEVSISATIIKIIDSRASVAIPGYNHAHSIPAPPKAKAKDAVKPTGEVRRVDDDSVTAGMAWEVCSRDFNHRNDFAPA